MPFIFSHVDVYSPIWLSINLASAVDRQLRHRRNSLLFNKNKLKLCPNWRNVISVIIIDIISNT